MSTTHTPSLRELKRAIRSQGWTIESHRAHYKAYSPCRTKKVTFSASSSDQKSIHNIRTTFRRHGVIV